MPKNNGSDRPIIDVDLDPEYRRRVSISANLNDIENLKIIIRQLENRIEDLEQKVIRLEERARLA